MALLTLAACNKAPDGVISESKMAQLVADLNRAEYYVETHSNEFHNDSTRMALKQSIFARHGIDQELYDHSLEWYGSNMDVYIDVCDRAMRLLEDEKKSLHRRMQHEPQPSRELASSQATYASSGDTADVWSGRRLWTLTSGMRQGFIQWDQQPDDEHQPGDKYMLRLRIKASNASMTAVLAADYNDGTTTTITRPLATSDWNVLTLQTDTLRQLRRVYGYIRYDMRPLSVAMIDSVSLVRTHLDRNTYGLLGSQTTVDRHHSSQPNKVESHPTPAVPDTHELRDQADARARRAEQNRHGAAMSKRPGNHNRTP